MLHLQGVIYLRKGSFAKAQVVLETAAQLEPSNARTLSALGMAYVDQNIYEQAVRVLEYSVQIEAMHGTRIGLWLSRTITRKTTMAR